MQWGAAINTEICHLLCELVLSNLEISWCLDTRTGPQPSCHCWTGHDSILVPLSFRRVRRVDVKCTRIDAFACASSGGVRVPRFDVPYTRTSPLLYQAQITPHTPHHHRDVQGHAGSKPNRFLDLIRFIFYTGSLYEFANLYRFGCSGYRRHWDLYIIINRTMQGHACWSDEDLIGRISRLARTVHPLGQSLRTLQKALGCYREQIVRLKRINKW